jgi:hypothetical protein
LLDNILPGNILLDNILLDDILFNKESGINKISDSDFNRDLDNNDSLYYKRISIDDKQDFKNISFGDNKQVNIAFKLYS